MTEPAHIRRAKELLTQAIEHRRTENRTEKPVGVTTVSDILAAESALAAAQQDLKTFLNSDDSTGLRQFVTNDGVTKMPTLGARSELGQDISTGLGLAVSDYRAKTLELKQQAVARAIRRLQDTKRAWLAGSLES